MTRRFDTLENKFVTRILTRIRQWVNTVIQVITFESTNFTPQHQYRANLLAVIIVGNLGVLSIIALYIVSASIPRAGGGLVAVFVSALINIWAFYHVSKGHTRLASRLVVGFGWIGVCLTALSAGGLYSSAIMALVTLFIIGLLLLDRVAQIILYLVTVIYFFFLWGIELSGNLPYAPFKDLPFRMMMLLIIFTGLFVIVGYHLYAITKSQKLIKDLQIEAERREMQRSLTQDLAHDLRTPVSVLKTNAYLIRKRTEKGLPTDEALDSLEQKIDDLSLMIEELFQLTLLDTKIPRRVSDVITLDVLLVQCVDVLSNFATKKGIELTCEIEPNIVTTVHGDNGQLKRAFENLIKNALQYNHRGGTVVVQMSNADDNIVVSITDTGIGIAPHDLEHIFERFYRANKARTLHDKVGTGIGLSATKRIISLHNGYIKVDSIPDKGSTFTVVLPLIRI